MSEPATTTSIAISAGTITLTGSFLGMSYDALLFGFVGVLFALRFLPPMTQRQLITSVASTTILAALLAPILAAWCVARAVSLLPVAEYVRLSAAFGVGAAALFLFPAAIGFARRRLGVEAES